VDGADVPKLGFDDCADDDDGVCGANCADEGDVVRSNCELSRGGITSSS